MSKAAVSLRGLLLVNTAMLGIVALVSCWTSINVVYVAFFSGLMAVAVAIDAFGRMHPPRLILNVAGIAILTASVLRMRFDNFIVVFTEAILLMTALKMLEEKRSRDYFQIAAMSVFTIISAAVDAVDGTYIYYGMIESFLVGYQFILSAWFAHASESSLTSKEFFQTVGRLASIWVMMLPICLVLFFAAPRARLSLGQVRRNFSDSTVGFSDRVALGSVRNIQEDNSLAFRAGMPRIAPKYLYWRGLVLDVFDGREWFYGTRERPERLAPQGGETVKQDIFIENGAQMRLLFALDVPLMINAPNVATVGDGVFANTSYRNRVRSYSAISSLSDRMRPPSGGIRRDRYLKLPDNFSPRMQILTEEIVRGLKDRDKPGAIMEYLSPPEFAYSLTDLPVSQTPLEEFVFQAKRGNCEYYATAMAVMLRMSGVPSRIVAGYHGGVYNDSGDYYVVSQSNAHVWVEAWDDGERAWRRYNPTPASAGAGGGTEDEVRYGFFWKYVDYINYNMSRIFMEYEGDTQSRILEAAREFIASPGVAIGAFLDRLYNDRRKTYSVIAAAVFICLAFAVAKCFGRFRRLSRRSRDYILKERFLSAMKRCGFIKLPQEGLEEFAKGVSEKRGAGDAVSAFAAEFVLAFEEYYFRDIPIELREFKRLEDLIGKIRKTRVRP
jgi:transglutaminase-like putative cysteine protease